MIIERSMDFVREYLLPLCAYPYLYQRMHLHGLIIDAGANLNSVRIALIERVAEIEARGVDIEVTPRFYRDNTIRFVFAYSGEIVGVLEIYGYLGSRDYFLGREYQYISVEGNYIQLLRMRQTLKPLLRSPQPHKLTYHEVLRFSGNRIKANDGKEKYGYTLQT